MSATYANGTNQIAALKELYKDNQDYLKDLVYKENPWLAMVPKDESIDGMAGKYVPVPIIFGDPQGRSNSFTNAQNNQTPTSIDSFFVTIVQDYQLVTITNLFMEQTATNAGAFIDGVKLQMDAAFRNITNNLAFSLFNDGTGARGRIGAYSNTGAALTITLSNSSDIVQFEKGMTLVSSTTRGGAPSSDTAVVNTVNRQTGAMTLTCSNSSPDAKWAVNSYLAVDGDVPSAGTTSIATALCLAGMGAWIPSSDPSPSENFFGVDRSVDPTRLGGIRYDASSVTIEEGITNAMSFVNREGGRPDLCILDFASFSSLINSLGAKVQYVQVQHGEVDVAFSGVNFISAYGPVTVLADRNCPPQTAYLLRRDTWKLRSLGKVPKILTYGMEGLEGLRVGTADALEIRIAYYAQLVCSAPGWNARISLSA
jgi:hypothetical protein